MQLHSIIIHVNDIDKAISFYTNNLNFKKSLNVSNKDIRNGSYVRKTSLISTDLNSDLKITFSSLANSFNPLLEYKDHLFKSGVPYIKFLVKDIDSEYKRLKSLGVRFSLPPQLTGLSKIAIFDDSCGNYIQINEEV